MAWGKTRVTLPAVSLALVVSFFSNSKRTLVSRPAAKSSMGRRRPLGPPGIASGFPALGASRDEKRREPWLEQQPSEPTCSVGPGMVDHVGLTAQLSALARWCRFRNRSRLLRLRPRLLASIALMTTAAPWGRTTSANSDTRPFSTRKLPWAGRSSEPRAGSAIKGYSPGRSRRRCSTLRVCHADPATSEHRPVALRADCDTGGRLVGPGMFHAEPSLDRGLKGVVEYAVIAEATNSLDRDPSRRDRFTERVVFGARIDERQELSLAGKPSIRYDPSGPVRVERIASGKLPIPLKDLSRRDRTPGRINAKTVDIP